MNKTITQETLISFIYNELSPRENLEVQHVLDADQGLKSEYEALLLAIQQLKPIEIQTDEGSRDLILKYSKNVSSIETSF